MVDKKQKPAPATKADLLELKTELTGKIDSLDRKIDSVKTGLNKNIDSVETGLNQKIDSIKTELKQDISVLDKKIDSVKTELNNNIDRVYASRVSADIKLDKKMDTMMDKINDVYSRIMSAFEQTVVKGEKYDQKALTHAGILTAHEDTLATHERRISLLEAKK